MPPSKRLRSSNDFFNEYNKVRKDLWGFDLRLMQAIENEDLPRVQEAIHNGAKLTVFLNAPLRFAAFLGKPHAVAALLHLGADPSDDGYGALMAAATEGHVEVIKELQKKNPARLEQLADAFYAAIENEKINVMELLATPEMMKRHGADFLDWAKEKNKKQAIGFLNERRGDYKNDRARQKSNLYLDTYYADGVTINDMDDSAWNGDTLAHVMARAGRFQEVLDIYERHGQDMPFSFLTRRGEDERNILQILDLYEELDIILKPSLWQNRLNDFSKLCHVLTQERIASEKVERFKSDFKRQFLRRRLRPQNRLSGKGIPKP